METVCSQVRQCHQACVRRPQAHIFGPKADHGDQPGDLQRAFLQLSAQRTHVPLLPPTTNDYAVQVRSRHQWMNLKAFYDSYPYSPCKRSQ